MSRKKQSKPLFSVKHDFIDSLEAFIQASMNLQFAVKTALDLGQVNETAARILKEHIATWEKATLSEQGEES